MIRFSNVKDLKDYVDSIDRKKCSMAPAHMELNKSKYYELNFFVPMWHYDCNGNKLWASYNYDNNEYIFTT